MLFEAPKGTKLRHEWKHIISPSDQAQLIARLSTFCSPDPHYGAQSYHIRSLYFDNVYDKTLRERLNGQECREKFRIRYYNFDDSYIVLEKKSKFKDLCGKQSTPITREEVELLLRGDIDWLMQKESPLCHELYAKMRGQLLKPKVIVDYTRQAFVYAPGNTRITLDYDVRTGLSSLDFFNPKLATIPADFTRPIILEVKYDAYLPDNVRRAIRLNDRRTTNFSKYAACRLTDF
jgi:hypothetical protein